MFFLQWLKYMLFFLTKLKYMFDCYKYVCFGLILVKIKICITSLQIQNIFILVPIVNSPSKKDDVNNNVNITCQHIIGQLCHVHKCHYWGSNLQPLECMQPTTNTIKLHIALRYNANYYIFVTNIVGSVS